MKKWLVRNFDKYRYIETDIILKMWQRYKLLYMSVLKYLLVMMKLEKI